MSGLAEEALVLNQTRTQFTLLLPEANDVPETQRLKWPGALRGVRLILTRALGHAERLSTLYRPQRVLEVLEVGAGEGLAEELCRGADLADEFLCAEDAVWVRVDGA